MQWDVCSAWFFLDFDKSSFTDHVADSTEYDFELSTVCYRPEGLDKLQEQTKFTKKELQVLYRGFKNECPSGVVNEETFKLIYSQFFPQGGNLPSHNKKTIKQRFLRLLSCCQPSPIPTVSECK
ncbi:UNVERIFIED_CONTAM: hypothetical protein FKN15_070038 [Acipenser sinensis]